jgi:hypothetical protein
MLIPLLQILFVLLFLSPISFADSTFYSVNILKTLFSTPHADFTLDWILDTETDQSISSPEPALPAFHPAACACAKFQEIPENRS